MALNLSKNSMRGSVGLDLDGNYVAAVQMAGDQVARAASMELPAGLIDGGEVRDPHALGALLKDFFKQAGLPKWVRLGVANQQIVVRQIELPRIDGEAELAAAVRFEASEAIAMPLDDAVLDHQVVGERVDEDGAPRLRVVVVAARRTMVQGFVDAVRGAGLKPEGIDLDAFALVRTLAVPGLGEDKARMYCHLGGVTNLAVAVGTTCLFSRPLPSSPDSDDFLTSLAEDVRLSLDYYAGLPGAPPVGDAVLSGPRAHEEGLAEQLSDRLGLPVSVADPLGGRSTEGLPQSEEPHRYTVAAGLALGAAA